MTLYVNSESRLQKRHSIRNIAQPTGSLYDFRFKSYGPLCDFYKSGDLDLDLNPNLTKKTLPGYLDLSTSTVPISERSDQWCGLYDREQTDRQTDRQTNRGDQYTLQKSTILQSNNFFIQFWFKYCNHMNDIEMTAL